ncbi:Maf family protein [Novosphingobium sp. JCM 18896]|uniref:Maf family protein n=1 Tax=Novosphingobium sp. JCM 18896 TaxID=2989731 RepID=UPI0022227273|nr:nucleoside triphosphate pyrophosphatase [Novosphingobium sp. JCM 18896]MCW1429267.1 Maf family protein [Novosphingobium sp. JCM 18896]
MLILASQSGSRKAMLAAAGVPFQAIPAHIDERAIEESQAGKPPEVIALLLAEQKAFAVSCEHRDALVLGSDSLVAVDGKRFDKPRSREEAEAHLCFFSGRTMHLHSAAALVRDGATLWTHAATATLHVREMTQEFIEAYLDAEWPAVAGCVGVFRIEALGVQLFDAIEGDHFTVLGMPLLSVLGALRQFEELPA